MAKTAQILLLLLVAVVVQSYGGRRYFHGGDDAARQGNNNHGGLTSGDLGGSIGAHVNLPDITGHIGGLLPEPKPEPSHHLIDHGGLEPAINPDIPRDDILPNPGKNERPDNIPSMEIPDQKDNKDDNKKNNSMMISVLLPGGGHITVPANSLGNIPSYSIVMINGQPTLLKNPGGLGIGAGNAGSLDLSKLILGNIGGVNGGAVLPSWLNLGGFGGNGGGGISGGGIGILPNMQPIWIGSQTPIFGGGGATGGSFIIPDNEPVQPVPVPIPIPRPIPPPRPIYPLQPNYPSYPYPQYPYPYPTPYPYPPYPYPPNYPYPNNKPTGPGKNVSNIPPNPPPQPQPFPQPQPEPCLEPQPEPRPEPQPEPRPEPQPQPRPNPQPGRRPEPRPEPLPEPQPKPRPEPQPKPSPGPRPEPRPELPPVRERDPRPKPLPEPQPEPQPEPRPNPQPEPGLNPEREPHLQPRPEPRPEPQPEPRPEPRPKPRPQPRPEPYPEPQPEHRPGPQPQPRPKPQPEPHPEPRPEPRPEPQPEPCPEPNWEPLPEPQPKPYPGPLEPYPDRRPELRPGHRPEPRPEHPDHHHHHHHHERPVLNLPDIHITLPKPTHIGKPGRPGPDSGLIDILNILLKFPDRNSHPPKNIGPLIKLLLAILKPGDRNPSLIPNLNEDINGQPDLSNLRPLLLHLLDGREEPNLNVPVEAMDEGARANLNLLLQLLANNLGGSSSYPSMGYYQPENPLLYFLGHFPCDHPNIQALSGMQSNSNLWRLLANMLGRNYGQELRLGRSAEETDDKPAEVAEETEKNKENLITK